jgi:YVTN family beta-propeller protein
MTLAATGSTMARVLSPLFSTRSAVEGVSAGGPPPGAPSERGPPPRGPNGQAGPGGPPGPGGGLGGPPRFGPLGGGGWSATHVTVGKGPEGFDVSPDGKEVWAANSHDGTVSIIDVAKKSVVETLTVAREWPTA